MLVRATDEELIEKLVAVRGLGRWSVEMFACFGLKRMDVFSTGDLGVQYVVVHSVFILCYRKKADEYARRGMAIYIGRDTNRLKSKGGKWKYVQSPSRFPLTKKPPFLTPRKDT
jgi:DNA-3-methyladenine glycosylase II